MRFLQVVENGDFILTEDLASNIPPYAILSHTWAEDHEEVSFEDLTIGSKKTKSGYKKLRFCAEQAARDGLQHFWVDTCCINKSNSVELQEAINSMFHWYRNAAKCYIYLSDVSAAKWKARHESSRFPWETAFRASKWFTRGWTLQELLAPGTVEFFSREGTFLGSKETLERQICEITGLPAPALRGAPLSQFRVEERFSWAENRQTTRKEDIAYSLLGIFNVYIPLIYGEGRENAFRRLREEIGKLLKESDISLLNRVPCAIDAPFNAFAKQHEPSCLPDTRVDLLQLIHNWADGQDERYIFWLNGLAGTGKSTIARTIARKYFEEKRLGASFFFTRGGGDAGHAGKFCTTIAVQLAERVPELYRHISDTIADNSSIVSQSLNDQWRQLVLRPLSKLDSNSHLSSYILVIDALDECNNNRNIGNLLQLLAEVRSLKTVRLRVFLTSRPEVPIRYGYYQLPENERYDLVLHNISPSIVSHDISNFLKYNLGLIGEEQYQDDGWPGSEVITTLVQSASGLFIWAATACRFIRDGLFADERLQTLLQGDTSIMDTPEGHLNEIYLTVLQNSIQQGFSLQDKERFCIMLRHILGSIVTLLSPLSVNSLSKLLATPRQKVDRILKDLHAILDIPRDDSFLLRLHHPSFRDFLLDKSRCSDPNFWVQERQAHQILAESCLRLMSTSLQQDICKLDAPGILITEVDNSRVEQYLSPEVQYACLYWVEHLQKSDAQFQDNDPVHQFLETHLLHWLEALSLMRRISEGVVAIQSLESIALGCNCPQLYAIIHDMKRFVLYSRLAIEQAPLQIYHSALIFAPATSKVRKLFKDRIPKWMRRLPAIPEDWSASLLTLEGHGFWVNSVAFSHDSMLLASASEDTTIKLWDAATGAALNTLEGHTSSVNSIAFSHDSALLVSASVDKTVRIWDAVTGVALNKLQGHKHSVNSAVFSHDSALLASASFDKTIKLWDPTTGAALNTLKGHTDRVISVVFSHDSTLLASASDDETIKLWDPTTGAALNTLEGHTDRVISVVFSHFSSSLVSASSDNTIKLWDTTTGATLMTLEGHMQGVRCVTISHDGMLLASASYDRTVRLWDVATGKALKTLKGHTHWVHSVTFSHNSALLASAASDMTIRLWDVTMGVSLNTPEGHRGLVSCIEFSHDGALLASASDDNTIKLWDAATGVTLKTLEGHTHSAASVEFFRNSTRVWVCSITFSLDSTLLASASRDKTVRLWDTKTGTALRTLEGHTGVVSSVVFSHDGTRLASSSRDTTVRIWDAIIGTALRTLEGHTAEVTATVFSRDGTLLASGSRDETVRIWDTATGTALRTLEGHTFIISSLAFSHDGMLIASSSYAKTVRIWDAATGTPLKTISPDSTVRILSFSPNGPFLETNCGLLQLEGLEGHYPLGVSRQPVPRPHMFLNGNWVLRNSERILWLPTEYRGFCSVFRGNILASGHGDGRVTVMEFS